MGLTKDHLGALTADFNRQGTIHGQVGGRFFHTAFDGIEQDTATRGFALKIRRGDFERKSTRGAFTGLVNQVQVHFDFVECFFFAFVGVSVGVFVLADGSKVEGRRSFPSAGFCITLGHFVAGDGAEGGFGHVLECLFIEDFVQQGLHLGIGNHHLADEFIPSGDFGDLVVFGI